MKARTPRHGRPCRRIQSRTLAGALAALGSAVFVCARSGRIVWANEAFSCASGYPASEAVGQTPRILKSGRQDAAFYRELWQTILAGQVWRGEVMERRKDGTLYCVEEIVTPLKNAHGKVTHFVAVQHDITRRKQESDQDHYLAYHDVLTGLRNRAAYHATLKQAIRRASSVRSMFALLFVDLNDFKAINDTLGHHCGDLLLIAVARRLTAAVRREDVVMRMGGDEFAIIEADIPSMEAARGLARKLVHAISRPYLLEGRRVCSSASIGVAIYPMSGDDPELLLKNADRAMYCAKRRGPGQYELYDPSLGNMTR
jgi:diguanylate cyclase (GGDEF)-like protein/PAS domain S-box-containing protein